MKNPNALANAASFLTRVTLTAALLPILMLGNPGCIPTSSSGSATADEAALIAGHAEAGLEGALFIAGLLADVPPDALPEDGLIAAQDIINAVFGGCAEATALTGESRGLSITFAEGGCGIPGTPASFQGSVSLIAMSAEDSAMWELTFGSFAVAGAEISGRLTVTLVGDSVVTYSVERLEVAYGGEEVAIDASGEMTMEDSHAVIHFSGDLRVFYDGRIYTVTVTNIRRSLRTDCYPEAGTITVTVADEEGNEVEATVVFEDDLLDSDDSGRVVVRVNDERHIADLPARTCTGY